MIFLLGSDSNAAQLKFAPKRHCAVTLVCLHSQIIVLGQWAVKNTNTVKWVLCYNIVSPADKLTFFVNITQILLMARKKKLNSLFTILTSKHTTNL